MEITVYAGADDGKVYLADVPSQQAAYVRAGFEALRRTEEKDPLISKPTHKVTVDRGVGVPMRDGVKLATDVYRPEGDGKYPVILIRTPYKKEVQELEGMYYARRGYAVAVQDVRGRFASPGQWEPFVHEPDDGYDAVEWLAARPWSTGKVGMVGGSYVGWVQWMAASRNPPHLATIIPNVSPPDPFYNFPYDHGVFFQWAAIWWADVLATEATADLSGAAMEKTFERKYGQLLRPLPVIDLDKKVLGKENPFWRTWIDHPTDDDYWAKIRFHDKLADVKIPVFHQSGWFDGDGIGSKLNYLAMARHGHPHQKLVLGPVGAHARGHPQPRRPRLRPGGHPRPAAGLPPVVRPVAQGGRERDRQGAAGQPVRHELEHLGPRADLPAPGDEVREVVPLERRERRTRRRGTASSPATRRPPTARRTSTPTTRATRPRTRGSSRPRRTRTARTSPRRKRRSGRRRTTPS